MILDGSYSLYLSNGNSVSNTKNFSIKTNILKYRI